MNYKRLGNYIRQVNVRNRDSETDVLLGVSITKKLIPSIANVIGTDMSVYKIIEKRQFAYGTVTSRNGEKISIALLDQYEKALVSQIYVVFEVIDTEELLPEYLMMWFSRPEFDRYVRFHSHGSTRETFDWADMCEVELPIPSIEEQRQIVAQYQSITNKIKVNEQICEKLKATAQALYKHWFVDFEFPNESGKPYKSFGGKMVWNEELRKEIPEGWKYDYISNTSKEIITGKTPPTDDEENFGTYMPFVTIPDMHNSVFVTRSERYLSEKGVGHQKNKTLPINSICVSCIGTAGLVSITAVECQTNQQINSIICQDDISVYFIYITLKALEKQIIEWGSRGSVGINMNKTEFSQIKILIPKQIIMSAFDKLVVAIFESLKLKSTESQRLTQLQSLLLSRLAVGEEVNA